MKKLTITTAAALSALAAACVWASPPRYVKAGEWGSKGSGNGQFYWPYSLALAPNGNVYVADTENHRVQYFTADGSFLGKWGSYGNGDGQFDEPVCLTVAPGGTVYVSEIGNHRVQYFTSSGSFLGKWGSLGTGDGQFNIPFGVRRAPNGYIYVVDSRNHRVQYFTAAGSFLGKWGSPGTGNAQFNEPDQIAFRAGGTAYVTDYANDRVQYFTATGSFLGKWSTGVASHPTGVDVGPDGTVFVGLLWYRRIYCYTAKGSYLNHFCPFAPAGVRVTPDGSRVYATDNIPNHRVVYFEYANPAVAPASLGRVKALFR